MRRAVALAALLVGSAYAQDPAPPARPPEPALQPLPPVKDAQEKLDRRRRLAALAGPDALVLALAAEDSPGFTGSTQNLDFRYLSPFDARGAAVLCGLERVAEAGMPPRTLQRIYLRPRNPAFETWSGVVAGPGEDTKTLGAFDDSLPIDRLAQDLAELLQDRKTLYVSAGGPADGAKLLTPLLAAVRARLPGTLLRLVEGPGAGADDLAESIKRALPEKVPQGKSGAEVLAGIRGVDVRSARTILAELREVKSASEIAAIRAAVDATVLGFKDALRAARPGMTETQVAAYVEFRCRLSGCARQAYPSIVGSGPNSCVLHYMRNERTLAEGDLVVMDIGGEFEEYASDVTRTFPAGGKFTAEQARVYDAVLAAQEAGVAAVKPGATLNQVHSAAVAVLKEKGLLQYFLHFTSHSVGLYVHDPIRGDAKLRPGCVITVEPGAYIAAQALGVRIEDTVLVTETGCENLSAALVKTREGIEKLMAEDARYPSDQ